jgi:hypothetical protein
MQAGIDVAACRKSSMRRTGWTWLRPWSLRSRKALIRAELLRAVSADIKDIDPIPAPEAQSEWILTAAESDAKPDILLSAAGATTVDERGRRVSVRCASDSQKTTRPLIARSGRVRIPAGWAQVRPSEVARPVSSSRPHSVYGAVWSGRGGSLRCGGGVRLF